MGDELDKEVDRIREEEEDEAYKRIRLRLASKRISLRLAELMMKSKMDECYNPQSVRHLEETMACPFCKKWYAIAVQLFGELNTIVVKPVSFR